MKQSKDNFFVEKAMNFFNSDSYMIPSRENEEYVGSSFKFSTESKHILRELLKIQLESLSISDEEEINLLLDAHGQTKSNDLNLITGHSGGPLSDEGVGTALSFFKRDQMPDIKICSDSIRAIHHTIAKYHPDVLSSLDNLVSATPSSLIENFGLVERDVQLDWILKALEFGIIPTPLLRTKFYGSMELFFEKNAVPEMERVYFHIQEKRLMNLGLGKKASKEVTHGIREALKNRKEASFYMEKDGIQITETHLDIQRRIDYLMKLFLPAEDDFHKMLKGKRIQLVSHSGTNDIILSSLRKYKKPNEILIIKRSKSAMRGESINVTVSPSKSNNHFHYLNDPEPVDKIKNKSIKTAFELRESSLDSKIKSGEEGSIIPLELIGFEPFYDELSDKPVLMPYKVYMEELLELEAVSLVLSYLGGGKSMGAIDLTERIASISGHVPVLVTARDLNPLLHRTFKNADRTLNSKESQEKNIKILLDNLSLGATSLNNHQRDEQHFVFVFDAFDELDKPYKPIIKNIIASPVFFQNMFGKNYSAIITSRFSDFNQRYNLGFKTFHVDPEAAMRHSSEYAEKRIEDEMQREDFKKFLDLQEQGVKTNYLLMHFLIDEYKKNPDIPLSKRRRITEGDLLVKGMVNSIWNHKVKKDPTLQEPLFFGDAEAFNALIQDYEELRDTQQQHWLDFLKNAASYMDFYNLNHLVRDQIENIYCGEWDIFQEILKSNSENNGRDKK